MGRVIDLPLRHRQALNKTLVFMKSAPSCTLEPPEAFIRALRFSLNMSQAALAKRSGLTQAHIAAIEAGRTNVGIKTLRKVFRAMFCDLVLVPRARKRPSDALAERMIERLQEPEYYQKRRPWD